LEHYGRRWRDADQSLSNCDLTGKSSFAGPGSGVSPWPSGRQTLGSYLVRHSFGPGMARAGASIADIQDVLGHELDKMAQ
jgi:hypothetical protein